METDYQKLLNACKEYRAKLDEALEANNELSERLSTIFSELQKENTKLKDELKEEKIHRSLDGWNEAAIINELKRENARLQMELDASCNAEELRQVRAENAALRDSQCTTWHLEKLLAENAALRVALEDIMTETDEQVIWRMARAALERKEAQP